MNRRIASFVVVAAVVGGCDPSSLGLGTTDQAVTCPSPTSLETLTSGDVTIDTTQREVLVPMSPPLGRSILFFSVSERESSPRYGNVVCELIDADTTAMTPAAMRCKHESMGSDFSPATPITVHWSVATFTSGVVVQRGFIDTSTTNPLTATLATAVDPAKSFIVLGGAFAGGGGWGNNDFTRAQLLDASTIEIRHNAAGALVPWQVVQMDGAVVTRGSAALASADTTASVPLTAPAGSFVLASYTSDNPSSIVASALMLKATLGASSLDFSRGAGGASLDIAYEVITPPFAVQQFTTDLAATEATQTQAVSGFPAATSIAIATTQSILGTSGGSTTYSDATDLDLVGEGAATLAVGANGVTVTRASATASASITWTAINFDSGCGPAATLTSDQAFYAPAQPITITFAGMSGSQYDWIAIASTTAPDNQYAAWMYTGGGASGQVTFSVTLPAGTYEARGYFDWIGTQSYTVAGRSAAFTVGGAATVTTDATSYMTGATVTAMYTGLPGAAGDTIKIAVPGSPASSSIASLATPGTPSGQVQFTSLPTGTYVARAFASGATTPSAESAQFSIGNVVSTNKADYLPNEAIVVSYTGLPPDSTNWVALATSGAPATSYLAWKFTDANASGQVSFAGLPAGTYEARVFLHNGFTLAGSVTFTVTAPTAPMISTDKATYTAGEAITLSYGLTGAQYDWVSLSTAGSPATSYVLWRFVDPSGMTTFASGLPAGSYEARLYSDNTYTILGTAAFNVTP